jgi:hypothetical protein
MGQRRNKIENVEEYLLEAVDNIRTDRTVTNSLLAEIIREIKKTPLDSKEHVHKDLGLIAAKYVETLQRSNEQLVKITSLLHKGKKESEELTEQDRNELYDLIQEN